MSDAKHSPGPWRLGPAYQSNRQILCDYGGPVCEVYGIRDPDNQANAHLITAAPDLLAALIGCVEHMEHSTPQGRAAWTIAHTAIAKAKGGAA